MTCGAQLTAYLHTLEDVLRELCWLALNLFAMLERFATSFCADVRKTTDRVEVYARELLILDSMQRVLHYDFTSHERVGIEVPVSFLLAGSSKPSAQPKKTYGMEIYFAGLQGSSNVVNER